MSKAFTLNSIFPSITSVTKTEPIKTGVRPAARPVTRSSRGVSKNWIGAASLLGVVATVMGLGFYVFMINASASTGYELKHQQVVMQQLGEKQKQLVIQQAAMGSIVKVNDLASTAGMIPVTGEEFLVANQISNR
jgi:hypothetical protein